MPKSSYTAVTDTASCVGPVDYLFRSQMSLQHAEFFRSDRIREGKQFAAVATAV